MTPAALALVLFAAVLHATWNYWAKRAGGGLPFVYLTGLMINLGYIPVIAAYWLWKHPVLPPLALLAIAGSGVLKTGYSLFLQRGYRTGDFSLIYPLARGTGPLLSALGALVVFHERPTALALAGGLLIVVSIFWLAGGYQWLRAALLRPAEPGERGVVSRAATYGLITGVFIAGYTLWDKRGVAQLMIAPVLFDAGTAFTQLLLLAPFAWKRRDEVRREWREHRFNAFVMATLSPVSYILVLTAMSFTPVSYIAPAREVSILIGMVFGARFLKEAEARRRLWAGTGMVAGLVMLAAG
ncbi:EamA family transporter [Opitutaceae bacterium EW11]|nr:EamA family transporter [Opitutaceae bacterium EW11]